MPAATEIMGVNYNFTPTFSANPGIGWDGFYACILSGNHPVGILIYAVVFGALRYGAIAAQTGLGVPLDLINIIKSYPGAVYGSAAGQPVCADH